MADLDIILKNVLVNIVGFKYNKKIEKERASEIIDKFFEFLDSCNLSKEEYFFVMNELSNQENLESFREYIMGEEEDVPINNSIKNESDKRIEFLRKKSKKYYLFLWAMQHTIFPNYCKNKFYDFVKAHSIRDLKFICIEIEKIYGKFKNDTSIDDMNQEYEALMKSIGCEMTEKERKVRELTRTIFKHHLKKMALFIMNVTEFFGDLNSLQPMIDFMTFLSITQPKKLLIFIDRVNSQFIEKKSNLFSLLKYGINTGSNERALMYFKLTNLI